jgi:hypothetical protein
MKMVEENAVIASNQSALSEKEIADIKASMEEK